MISPKVLEQIQKYQQEQKASIAAQMKGSIIAPLAKSVGPMTELTAGIEPKQDKKSNTEKTPAAKEKENKKLTTDITGLLKESKDQNTSLKKLIRLNETSIEDNSEFYSRLEKTMNALVDSISEQGRKGSLSGTSGNRPTGPLISPKSPGGEGGGNEGGGGFGLLDALGVGAGAVGTKKVLDATKGGFKRDVSGLNKIAPKKMSRLARGGRIAGGAAVGGLLGAGIFGMLSPEQQEYLRSLGIDEDAAGLAGSAVGGIAGAKSGKTPIPEPEPSNGFKKNINELKPPAVEPPITEPAKGPPKSNVQKIQEFFSTEKKPVAAEPIVEPIKPVEPTVKPTTPTEPTVKPVVEEPQFKFNEKTGRFHDTMKGVGGGEMISDAKAKELGLEKPKPTTVTEPVVEPKPVVEPAPGAGAAEKGAAGVVEEASMSSKAKGALGKAASVGGKILNAAAVPLTVGMEGYQSYEEYQAAEEARQKGEITQKEADKQKTSAVTGGVGGVAGALGGAQAGALGGAALGTMILPGVGTAIGGVLGGIGGGVLGAIGGRFLGKKAGEKGHELVAGKEEKKPENTGDVLDTSTDPQEIFNELIKNDPFAQDPSVQADLKDEAHMRAKANIQKQGGNIKGYVQKPLTTPEATTKATTEKPKVEAPKGNTEAGVTPDIDMGFQIGGRKEFDKELVNQTAAQPGVTPDISGGFQIEGRKEFDKDLVNQQAATPGVTPDIAGVMPSANETPPPPVQEKGKVEKPLSEEATKLIDQYMKVYEYGLKAMQTVLPLETKKEDLVAAADEKYSFDPMMLRKLQEIKRTPGPGILGKLKEKKLEAAEKLLQDKRISNAESSDAGNLGTDYKATELTPTVETPTFDAMGNAGGVDISGGEEVQSAMEAARASDEGNMGLITTAREASPELNKNAVQMQRSSNISKFGRSNAMGMDAFMGYNDEKSLALPTPDQAASMMGKVESTPKDEKINQIAESGSGQQTNVAPIIINNQGGDTYNTTTNASGGGSGGGAGSPTRTPNPYDSMVFGKSWEAYP
jgi:hypothetical protein